MFVVCAATKLFRYNLSNFTKEKSFQRSPEINTEQKIWFVQLNRLEHS